MDDWLEYCAASEADQKKADEEYEKRIAQEEADARANANKKQRKSAPVVKEEQSEEEPQNDAGSIDTCI